MSLARRESTWGLLFLAPWILGFILFFAGPMLASLGASFTDLVLVRPGDAASSASTTGRGWSAIRWSSSRSLVTGEFPAHRACRSRSRCRC